MLWMDSVGFSGSGAIGEHVDVKDIWGWVESKEAEVKRTED